MPYIISTTTDRATARTANGAELERHERSGTREKTEIARATLIAARDAVSIEIDRAWGPYATPRTTSINDDGRHYQFRSDALRMPATGGKIELPNGVVIELTPTDWAGLAGKLHADTNDMTCGEVLAAFNGES